MTPIPSFDTSRLFRSISRPLDLLQRARGCATTQLGILYRAKIQMAREAAAAVHQAQLGQPRPVTLVINGNECQGFMPPVGG